MDETQDTGLTVTEQPPAARLRTLSNGAVYDEDRHRIVANPPGGTTNRITTQTTQDMHERRREQARRRLMSGAKRGLDAPTWGYAIELIGEAQAKLAADPSRGRASTYAFARLWDSLDLMPARHGEAPAAGGITVHIGAQVAEMLAEMVFERQNG